MEFFEIRKGDETHPLDSSGTDAASPPDLEATLNDDATFCRNDTTEIPVSETAITHCCSAMTDAVEREDNPLIYGHSFREYGVRVLDGGTNHICIEYCPWCSTRLPDSLRGRWYAELETRGVDPNTDELPDDFKDDSWHQG